MQKIVENSKVNIMPPPPPPPRIVKCFLGIIIVSAALLACKKDDEPMNAAPTIEAQTFSVAENAGVDAAVGTVAAQDAQNDELTFAITEVSRSDAFAINAGTGAITVAGDLDHETTAAYTLTVQVSDGSLTADAEVTINVTDVNEAPVITAQTAPFSIEENAAAGTAVGTVAATDQDEGDDDLTFAITNGNTNEAFQIDNMGAITVKTPAALDFETTPTFTLTVQVSDDENLSSTADITVNLTDVAGNEAPIITAQTFSVTENAASGTAVGTVSATDAEGDNLTFAILSGNTSNAFAISAGTGELEVAGTIDYETTPTYTLTVQVSDGMMLATAAITINVMNVNDNAPAIVAQIFSISENAANGAAVGTVVATDADGDALTFSITDGNTGNAFAINTGTGAITVAGTLNRTTTQTYTLMVRVSDGTTSAEAAVTINVTDTGGNQAPTIAAQTFSIAEDAAANTPVGTVTATDADNDGLTFSITMGNDAGAFAINASSGAITVAGTLDHETTPNYTLTVQVSDGTATANAAITINVTNVNDNAPAIAAQTFSVAENVANGTAVGTVAATDADGDPLTFTITAGNTNSAFAINADGAITVAGTVDYETTQTYTLTVRASDGSTSTNAAITINVTNLNDNAPTIAAQTFSVAENAAARTIGTVMATDADGDALTFSITAGNRGSFAINAGSGAITVVGSVTLNHEATPRFTLTVQVSDGTTSANAAVTINVTDVNEAPVVTAQVMPFSLAESVTLGAAVGTVAATDDDGDVPTFSIASGNTGNAFAINENTGAITVAQKLDFETTPSYTLTISASDGSLSGTADFTVNVTNVARGARLTNRDIKDDTLRNAGISNANGIWSDGTTMWVAHNGTGESSSDRVFAFTLADGSRDKDKEISTLNAAGNNRPNSLWSNGTTLWVSDFTDNKLYAYTLSNGTRDAAKDINLDDANSEPNGLWSDGTTIWVVNNGSGSSDKVFAYTLSDGSRDATKDINSLNSASNNAPFGLWSDGTTLWVSDFQDQKLYAYTLSRGARNIGKDINTTSRLTFGLWSDGTTLWNLTSGNRILAYFLDN